MRLFGFLHKAENETPQNIEEKNMKGGKSAGAVLIEELIGGQNYEFGEPWQLTSASLSSVVPIIRKFDRDRPYLVVQEILEKSTTTTDSGRINMVDLRLNGVRKPVFVRAGTIFKGQGTQSRTSGMGVILEPGKENLIDVFCIHSSHGISARSGFSTIRDVVPRRVEDVLSSPLKSQTMVWKAAAVRGFRASVRNCPECGSSELFQSYEAELVCLKCGYVVASVPRSESSIQTYRQTGVDPSLMIHAQRRSSTSARARALHVQDNLVANLEEMKKYNEKLEDLVSKIPADLGSQVGVVIVDSRGVLGLEIFDHPDSWRAFSRSIVRNYADVLAKERAGEGPSALRTEGIPETIKKFLIKAGELTETTVFKNQIGETRMFSGELAGEYTAMGSNVIHLLLKRKTTA